jgi:hypothetical protein
MTNRDRWKRTERQIAGLIGGQRVPVTGRARGDAPDIAHERFSVEVKERAQLPGWLHDAMAQAVAAARGEQLPVAILHERGQRYRECYAVIRLADLAGLAKEMDSL